MIIIGHEILIGQWHSVKAHIAEGAIAIIGGLTIAVACPDEHVVRIGDCPAVHGCRPIVVGVEVVVNLYDVVGTVHHKGEVHPFTGGYSHSRVN